MLMDPTWLNQTKAASEEFRDHSGNIILHFSKQVSVNSTIMTKVLAIMEGILIAAASRWASLNTFYIESHSANVVCWFKNSLEIPWRFHNNIQESVYKFGRHITWSISHILCSGIEATDVLARFGISGL